jgi:hypothetical protein
MSLVSHPEGASVLVGVQDISPLTEIAPAHPLALDILSRAWLTATTTAAGAQPGDTDIVGPPISRLSEIIQLLVSSFRNTDAVTLLASLSTLFRSLPEPAVPHDHSWLQQLTNLIHALVIARPTAASREAYTNFSATLLQLYPASAQSLLFSSPSAASASHSDRPPASYLLVSLILIDLRSSLPTLLSKLNSPSYTPISIRLASAYDVLTSFTAHLLQHSHLDEIDESDDVAAAASVPFAPDLLIKLHKASVETLSATAEHLRDRYDAALAGAPGLAPEGIEGPAHTSRGSHLTLPWDAADPAQRVTADPLVLAALRSLALWLREDDASPALRSSAVGLMDMFVALYASPETTAPIRDAILVALEGLLPPDATIPAGDGEDSDDDDDLALDTRAGEGAAAFLSHDGWAVLAGDLAAILRVAQPSAVDARRGIEVARVLVPLVEQEAAAGSHSRDEWMGFVAAAGGWAVPDSNGDALVDDLRIAALQVAAALVEAASHGTRRRFAPAIGAAVGVAEALSRRRGTAEQAEDLRGILETLRAAQR